MAPSVHPVDLVIFSVFLVITLVVGLSTGRQVKTIKDYALGGKDFSTATLVATIVATWYGGGALFRALEKTYSIGLYYNIAQVGVAIGLFLSGRLASRMSEFMNNVSVAEAMGGMYGKTAQMVTAFSGILAQTGAIAIQFQVISRILVILFNLESAGASFVAAGIVILYSAFGGVRAVTFTDVIQFFTFGTVMPVLALVIWHNLQDPTQIIDTLTNTPNFNIKEVVSWTPEFRSTISLMLYFAIPALAPDLFQRMAMAKNVTQARDALTYAAGIALLISALFSWTGLLLLTDNPGLEPTQVVAHMINKYAYTGLRGLVGIGVTALAMSTADSCLNSAAVLFSNDIVKPLTGQAVGSTKAAKWFSIIGGIAALFLALYTDDLLVLLMLAGSFYMPIFTVPMLMAVLGFRSTSRAVLISMATGFTTVVVWSIFYGNAGSIVPGMLANLIVLLGSHYLLGEPGGWQKVDPDSPLGLARASRKEAWQRRLQAIRNFKLYPYLQQNLPQQEGLYSLFGFYAIIATYSALYAIEPADVKAYNAIYKGIVHTGLFATTALLTFPIWPPTVKSQRFITFFWPLGMAALLFFAGTLIAIMSHFQSLQMMVLMINLLIAVFLLRWSLALSIAVIGVSLALSFFHHYTGEALPWSELFTSQYRSLYGLVLFSSLLIALFRGKEAYAQLGKKNQALQSLGRDQQENLLQVAAEKHNALQALQGAGVDRLLAISRELQTMHVAAEDKERMQALQTELVPIAFQLQGIYTRGQDYLRLKIDKLPLQSWSDQIKEAVRQRGVTIPIHYRRNTNCQS